MLPEKKEIILSWYRKADEDLLTSKVVIEASPMLYDVAAFHSQQAAEKYLKAYLVFFEIMPPKIHNIKQLIDLIFEMDNTISEIRDAESLSLYSVRSRYPDDFEIDSKEQVFEILALSQKVKIFIQTKIGF